MSSPFLAALQQSNPITKPQDGDDLEELKQQVADLEQRVSKLEMEEAGETNGGESQAPQGS